ncbi:MAG: small multi-drug export protein [Clostridia bacterium]|nr:small multi-drug export protein [Clostridia bacterium]
MLNYLWVFLISMIPIIELRGAIPIGYYSYHLPIIPLTLVSIIGNIFLVPFIILFGGKILHYFAKFEKIGLPFRKIIELGEKKVAKMSDKARTALFWGLFSFVAIPLPGTGAWTGSLIAITLGIDFKKGFWPIALGVCTAGAIVVTVAYVAPEMLKSLLGYNG